MSTSRPQQIHWRSGDDVPDEDTMVLVVVPGHGDHQQDVTMGYFNHEMLVWYWHTDLVMHHAPRWWAPIPLPPVGA